MRSKGARGAGTIHSLIYRTRGEDENGPTFVLNEDSAAGKAALVVIDECAVTHRFSVGDVVHLRSVV